MKMKGFGGLYGVKCVLNIAKWSLKRFLHTFNNFWNIWLLDRTVRNIWSKGFLTQRLKIIDTGCCLQRDLESIFVLNMCTRKGVHEYDRNTGKLYWSLLNLCKNYNRILHLWGANLASFLSQDLRSINKTI